LFYDPLRGEFATVGIGTQPWFWVESISSYTGLDPANLVRIAGKARTLEIPDSMVYPLVDTGGKKTYIRGDFVEKLVAALPQRFSTEVSFVNGINSALRGREVVQSGASVTASNLYRMLGAGLHFEEWNCGMYTKNSQHFRDHRVNLPSTTTEDYWIPLTLACEIAAKESDFAGKLTLCLLSEGGYLHGGAIDEPANATLERFRGLVPDDMGRVRISKIWEFMNQKEALKEWFNHRAFLLWKYARTSFGYMVDVRSPWCGEIWETIFSEMYDPVLKLSSPVL
jgi:hypothetical protein